MNATWARQRVCAWSIGLGMLGAMTAVVSAGNPRIDRADALVHAADYLELAPDHAVLSERQDAWVVEAGTERAHIDARSGDLVEIEFQTHVSR